MSEHDRGDVPQRLGIPDTYDNESETWSWGLSPRIQSIDSTRPKKKFSRERTDSSLRSIPTLEKLQLLEESGLEPDMYLQVSRLTSGETPPLTSDDVSTLSKRNTQEKQTPVRPSSRKPDETFLINPGTVFVDESRLNDDLGPKAVVRKAAVDGKTSFKANVKVNKALVVKTVNEDTRPKLALVKNFEDTLVKPAPAPRKEKQKVTVSKPRKFKLRPYTLPEPPSKHSRPILNIPADAGSKLEALQRRLKYDASKYADNCVRSLAPSATPSTSSSEESSDDSSDEVYMEAYEQYSDSSSIHQTSKKLWSRGASTIVGSQRPISAFEQVLTSADKSIVANLEIESRKSIAQSASDTSDFSKFDISRDDTIAGSLEDEDEPDPNLETGKESPVSINDDDIAMFDSWVKAGTPAYDSGSEDRISSRVSGSPTKYESTEFLEHVIEEEYEKEVPDGKITVTSVSTHEFSSATLFNKSEMEEKTDKDREEEKENEEEDARMTETPSMKQPSEVVTSVVVSESPRSVSPRRLAREESRDLSRDLTRDLSRGSHLTETVLSDDEIDPELCFVEPTYTDILQVEGHSINYPPSREDVSTVITSSPTPESHITHLSTWSPDKSTKPGPHYSVHHFCTLALQPLIPRNLHNITRPAHTQDITSQMSLISGHCEATDSSLSWFEREVDSPSGGGRTGGHEEGGDDSTEIKPTIVPPPPLKKRRIYWTPAPPKMDLPPLFIKNHLFPQYESALLTAEHRELQHERDLANVTPGDDNETDSDDTEVEDRKITQRILRRRHNTPDDGYKRKNLQLLGPDKLQDRAFRIGRPGSAPMLGEVEQFPQFKSDYYTAYQTMEEYLEAMAGVSKSSEKDGSKDKDMQVKDEADGKSEVPPITLKGKIGVPKVPKPFVSIQHRTPVVPQKLPKIKKSFRKNRKVGKREMIKVKTKLLESRKLSRTTSTHLLADSDLGVVKRGLRRSLSEGDLPSQRLQWTSYEETMSGLKKTFIPALNDYLGTILSKEVLQLHQILKDKNPDEFREVVKEIRRLTAELDTPGKYYHYQLSRRGALYVKIGMFKEALSDLDSVIEAFPKMVDAYWHRHLISTTQGDYNSALNDLTNIIRHNQNQPRVYLARAEIYRRQGDITGAILNYSQALKRDKDNAETYYKRAQLFEAKGDILLALEDYTVANRLCPSNTVAIMKKGTYNFERGAHSVAVTDFTAMLEQDPYNCTAITYRGRSYAKMGKYKEALMDLSCSIHLDPTCYIPFYYRAVLLRHHDPKKAIQDFSTSLMLNSTAENSNAFLGRGILYTTLKQYDYAIPDFEAIIARNPFHIEAHINLGLICMQHLKQNKRAIKCFTGAINVDPTNDKALVCRADAHMGLKQYSEAILDYTRAIHLKPDEANYYIYRGKLLLEMGKLDLAAKHIKFASVLNEKKSYNGPGALQKAVVQSFLKNFDEAIFVLDRAAGLDPSPSQFILLGKTYLKARRYAEAIDKFEKALMYMSPIHQFPVFDFWEPDDAVLFADGENVKEMKLPKSAAEVYYLIGKCHIESNNYGKALEALNNAIKINPTYAEAYFYRGLVRIKVRSNRPLLDFNRALAYNPSYFQAYLTRAAYFAVKGRLSKALFNCNEALKIQPESVRGFVYRGAIKAELRSYDNAIKDLTYAIKLDPECSIAFYNRGVCYQHLRMLGKALKDYSIVLLLEKEHTNRTYKVLLNRGLVYYNNGDYNNALADFKLTVKDRPNDGVLYYTLGICYFKNNQFNEALTALAKAMELKKHFIEGIIARGNIFMSLNTEQGFRNSKRDFCRALLVDPQNTVARTNLGLTLQSYGKMNEAWKVFTSAIKIDDTYHQAYEARSVVNLQMGNIYGAFTDINRAVTLSPTSNNLTNRGVIQQFMRDPMNAMFDFKHAIDANPENYLAHYNAANLYFSMRQFEKALRHYDYAVFVNPDDEGIILNRAICKVLLKDEAGALTDFETAVALNPVAAPAYYNRANLHLTMGNFEAAELDLRRALDLQPRDSAAYQQLSVVLARMYRKSEAMESFKMALKLSGD